MSAKNTTFAADFDKKLADNEILNRHLSYRARLLQRTLAVLQDKVLKIEKRLPKQSFLFSRKGFKGFKSFKGEISQHLLTFRTAPQVRLELLKLFQPTLFSVYNSPTLYYACRQT